MFGFSSDPHSSASSIDNTLSLSAQSPLYKLWFEREFTEESLSHCLFFSLSPAVNYMVTLYNSQTLIAKYKWATFAMFSLSHKSKKQTFFLMTLSC